MIAGGGSGTREDAIDFRIVALLMACVAVIGANSLALGPIAPAIARDFGSSVVRVMLGASAYGLCTALSAFFLAPWIDRYGPRRMLRLAMVVLGIAMAGCAVAGQISTLVLAQGIAGTAAGIALPAVYALAAATAPPGRANTMLGRVLVGWTVSLVAGVSLSTLVADLLDWRYVYMILAGIVLVTFLGLLPLSATRARETGVAPGPASALDALGRPGVLPLLVICFAFMAAFYGTYGYVGDHIVNAIGKPLRAGGLVAISYGLGFGLAAFADPWIDRLGGRHLLPVSLFVVMVVYLLMAWLGGGYAWLVILVFAWGLANHAAVGLIVGGLAALDPARRGAIMGLQSAVTYLAVSAGTFAFGRLYRDTGFGALCLVAAGLLMASTVYARTVVRARLAGG